MSDKPNPLFIHGIIVIVVGVVILAMGAWGTISTMRRPRGAGGAMSGVSRGRMQMSQTRGLGRMNMRKPTSLGGAMSAANQLKYKFRLIKRFLGMGWQILLGGGMIAAGIFVLKQKNWARLVGFGGIGFAILMFASYEGALAASPKAGMVLPLILVVVVAGLSAKPLFDLVVEKFD